MISERRWMVGGAATSALYAVLASSTRPFTWAADIVTAVPIVAAGLATAWTSRGVIHHMTGERRDAAHQLRPSWDRRWMTWAVLTAVVTSWELYCLVSLPRTQHPTLSSLIDILDSSRVGKSVAFASWLALGWVLAAR